MGYFQDDKGRKDVSKILGFGAFVAGVLYSGLYVLMAVISDVGVGASAGAATGIFTSFTGTGITLLWGKKREENKEKQIDANERIEKQKQPSAQ